MAGSRHEMMFAMDKTGIGAREAFEQWYSKLKQKSPFGGSATLNN